MFIQQNKKFGFTLAETIIVCTVFAVMVIGIIFAINRAFIFVDNTRLAVMATNLAREGVEMMYNVRDSNRRKYSGERDKYWLCLELDDKDCHEKFGSVAQDNNTYYVLNEKETLDGDNYIHVDSIQIPASNEEEFYTIDGFFSDTYSGARQKAKLDFTGTYSYYSGGGMATGNLSDLLSVNGVEFYRVVRVYGIYCKINNCSRDSDPKEMRFCVKVFYRNAQGKHASELCSVMTNFME